MIVVILYPYLVEGKASNGIALDGRQAATEPRAPEKIWFGVLSALLVAVCLGGLYCCVGIPYRAERQTFHGDSSALRQTVVVPTLDSPLASGKNVIWCASYQAAWDHLRTASAGIIQQPPTLVGAEALSARLNRSPFPPADLPSTSYIAAGVVQNGIVPNIRSALRKGFPGAGMPAFGALEDTDIIAYGYLETSVHFPVPYLNAPPLTFAGSRVACFGIREHDEFDCFDLRRQARVLYHSKDEFIVDPCGASPVQVVLASVPPGATLAGTITATEQKINAWAKRKDESAKVDRMMHSEHLTEKEGIWMRDYMRYGDPKNDPAEFDTRDVLLIPNMHWVIDHRFSELEGKNFAPAGSVHYLKGAQQTCAFSLNRSGVNLKSIDLMKIQQKCGRRSFVYDHPFLLYLRLRGHAHPFFAMWVDNAELLTKI